MKFFKKSLFVIAIIASLNGFASEIDADFEMIDTATNVIVEKSDKATKGIDWNFELSNQSSDWVYVKLINDGQLVLPKKDELSGDVSADKDSHYMLGKGSTVRVAGLDLDKELELEVLLTSEKNQPQTSAFTQSPEAIKQKAQKEGRNPKAIIGKGNTVYMVIDENNKLRPVKKSLFRRTTSSGLPLDRNIRE